MANIKTYIQQTRKDSNSYVKGSVVDLLEVYKIVCQDFPFKVMPKAKELPKRDWADEDGVDVYVPQARTMQPYEMDVDFLYAGTDASIRTDLKNFIEFLYGRNANAVGSLLAIYNEHAGLGRKDVIVSEISDDVFYTDTGDVDAVATLKVKFLVCDPVTDVTLTRTTNNGNTTLALNF